MTLFIVNTWSANIYWWMMSVTRTALMIKRTIRAVIRSWRKERDGESLREWRGNRCQECGLVDKSDGVTPLHRLLFLVDLYELWSHSICRTDTHTHPAKKNSQTCTQCVRSGVWGQRSKLDHEKIETRRETVRKDSESSSFSPSLVLVVTTCLVSLGSSFGRAQVY